MRIAIALLLVLTLVGGVAWAEKLPDVNDAVPPSQARIVFSGTLSASSPVYDRIYGGLVSLDCQSNVYDSSMNGQYYEVFCMRVTNTDPIEIWVDANGTNISDTVMTLYCEPFDPSQPQLNVISYDDDDGPGLLSAFLLADNIHLVPGTNYYLVFSTFSSAVTGDFVIQTSDNVTVCVVDVETSPWGTVKNLYR